MDAYAFAALTLTGWLVHGGLLTHRLRTARRDPLTGLHTRHGWSARAERLVRRPDALVVLVDLDDFKHLNDTFGHAAGDAALVATAERLNAWCSSRGVAGRLGGDEFVAVVTTADGGAGIEDLAVLLDRPVPHGSRPLPVAASIGACPVAELPVPTLTDALAAADAAMYGAKGHRRR
ncbi:GGDEF domain-containing protein [Streptomyces sp. ST2-7A]|uniref:GGDEF domain-containing protein n=1 Tax=Streptomyces sp. ST2-7A TaxID=2907214 RepID=UPI001F379EED|nr:GGDEF domain-containing protein [Streptomyces sp. ST2-7A]MCE7079971.1 GGDEF domain-containing protein [Streptomyces sp. ST2-7A]